MKNVKAIVTLLIIAAAFFASFKLFPPYYGQYSLQQDMDDLARTWTYAGAVSQEKMKDLIIAKAKDDNVVLTEDNINVERTAAGITININYTVPVSFPSKTVDLKFEVKAGNKLITAK